MGAAFLLLETKNVVQFALLFGTTWFVNALVFGGILVTVLVAIEVARRVRPARPAAALRARCWRRSRSRWIVPAGSPAAAWRCCRGSSAVIALAFTPIFIANLIFAERFKEAGSSAIAFGANLLGAMVGGVLEYSALLIGYRALLAGRRRSVRAGVRVGSEDRRACDDRPRLAHARERESGAARRRRRVLIAPQGRLVAGYVEAVMLPNSPCASSSGPAVK